MEVPLICRWPGHIPAGVATDALAGTLDIFPTVLEAADAPASERCFGKSLWPVFRDPSATVHDAVLSEVVVAGRHRTMVRTDRYRCTLAAPGDTYELYDLEQDPTERRNLAGHPDLRDVEADLRDRLVRMLVSTQTQRPMTNA